VSFTNCAHAVLQTKQYICVLPTPLWHHTLRGEYSTLLHRLEKGAFGAKPQQLASGVAYRSYERWLRTRTTYKHPTASNFPGRVRVRSEHA
jgi:hypothetical protein